MNKRKKHYQYCDNCKVRMKRLCIRDDENGYYICPICGQTMGEETKKWFKQQRDVTYE